jgi:hypothetical protein
VEDIEETIFSVKMEGGGFKFVVEQQMIKR